MGDVDCPGTESTNVSPDLVSVIDVFVLTQLVPGPTQGDNLLNIFACQEDYYVVEDVKIDVA